MFRLCLYSDGKKLTFFVGNDLRRKPLGGIIGMWASKGMCFWAVSGIDFTETGRDSRNQAWKWVWILESRSKKGYWKGELSHTPPPRGVGTLVTWKERVLQFGVKRVSAFRVSRPLPAAPLLGISTSSDLSWGVGVQMFCGTAQPGNLSDGKKH